VRHPAIDFPDVTVLGWTPTDEQWTALLAVLAGAAAALLFMALWRKARRALIAAAITAAVVYVWATYFR
jgi:hypothetical protein